MGRPDRRDVCKIIIIIITISRVHAHVYYMYTDRMCVYDERQTAEDVAGGEGGRADETLILN